MKTINEREYISPKIKECFLIIEQGYAGSILNYTETPSMSYGDDSEQWF